MKEAAEVSSIVGLYLIFTGFAYETGYWINFGINPLEYASISDVASKALLPVSVSLFFLLFGYIGGPSLPDGGGKETFLGKFLNKYQRLIFKICFMLAAVPILLSALYGLNYGIWLVLPVFIVPIIWSYLREFLWAQRWSDSMLFLLILIPLQCFSNGKYDAAALIQNNNYKYTLIKDPINKALNSRKKYKFVGKLGQSMFFLSLDNQTLKIFDLKNINDLEIKTYPDGNKVASNIVYTSQGYRGFK